MTTTAAPATPATPPRRMSLAAVVKGKIEAPYRLVIHGPDGVGKTSFAADAPKPIFLDKEDGSEHLPVERFPTPADGKVTWSDVHAAVAEATNEQHDYQTFVIDTLDWLEPALWAQFARRRRSRASRTSAADSARATSRPSTAGARSSPRSSSCRRSAG
jgi:hypothetical protein